MTFTPFSRAPVKVARRALFATAAWIGCFAPVHAQDALASSPVWPARYPLGSIRSVEMADRALEEAASERAAIQARFASEEQACLTNFFVNACIDAAGERRRVALAAIRAVEIEANALKRKARVAERGRISAEKEENRPRKENSAAQ